MGVEQLIVEVYLKSNSFKDEEHDFEPSEHNLEVIVKISGESI